MKKDAWLINIARGDMIDDDALLAALHGGTIGGAFLDPTNPEPLPPEHPLWVGAQLHDHHAPVGPGADEDVRPRGAAVPANLDAFRQQRPMANVVDLEAGY